MMTMMRGDDCEGLGNGPMEQEVQAWFGHGGRTNSIEHGESHLHATGMQISALRQYFRRDDAGRHSLS